MIERHIKSLEKKISKLIKEAKKQKKKAKKAKAKQYFEGRHDAFEEILIELKNLKYELETSIEDDEDREELGQLSEEENNEHLLKKALEQGIITRKISFYYHEDLPKGKVQGKQRILEALSESGFHQKIQAHVANTEELEKEEN